MHLTAAAPPASDLTDLILEALQLVRSGHAVLADEAAQTGLTPAQLEAVALTGCVLEWLACQQQKATRAGGWEVQLERVLAAVLSYESVVLAARLPADLALRVLEIARLRERSVEQVMADLVSSNVNTMFHQACRERGLPTPSPWTP